MDRTAPSKLTGSPASLVRAKSPRLFHQSGFALLEIILAFAISVFVLGIALPGLSQTLKKLVELRSYSSALTLAQSKLEEYAFDCTGSPRSYKGIENGFFWQVSITSVLPTTFEGPSLGVYFLKKINVTVASAEHGEPLIDLSTHRLGELSP